jgi:TonB family protein
MAELVLVRPMRSCLTVALTLVALCGKAQSQSDVRPYSTPHFAWESRYHALSMPPPVYPFEARRQHTTGSGVVAIDIDPQTGLVSAAAMKMSTRSELLDAATIRAARKWRFAPHGASHLDIPVTFTIGAVNLH